MPDETALSEPTRKLPLGSRLVLLVLALPSVFVWGFLTLFSLVMLSQILVPQSSGMGSGRGGLVLFAFTMSCISLVGAVLSMWAVGRCYQGKAPLWWIAATLIAGIVCFMLFGLMGD
jgi:hypothetical protein